MEDGLEASGRSGTCGPAGDALPGPRTYARRWVFLLVVSLLSCSNAMVRGHWGERGGVFQQPKSQFVFAQSREPTFPLAQEVVGEGASACLAWNGKQGTGNSQGNRSVSLSGQTCNFVISRTLPSPQMISGLFPPSLLFRRAEVDCR